MLRKSALLLSILAFSTVGLRAANPDFEKKLQEGAPIAQAGEVKIYEGYLKLLEEAEPQIKNQFANSAMRKVLIDNLIDQELLYHAAIKRGLDKDPAFQNKAELFMRRLVAMNLIQEEVKKKAIEVYNRDREQEFEQVKVDHIFFSSSVKPKKPETNAATPPSPITEEEKKAELEKAKQDAAKRAQDASTKLKQGTAWAEVAKESDDKFSAQRGEWSDLRRADPRVQSLEYKAIVNAAFSMKKGAISEPIQAKDGWHIIRIVEEKKVLPFEQVYPLLKMKVEKEIQKSLLETIKKDIKVDYLDKTLLESQPASAPLTLPAPRPIQ